MNTRELIRGPRRRLLLVIVLAFALLVVGLSVRVNLLAGSVAALGLLLAFLVIKLVLEIDTALRRQAAGSAGIAAQLDALTVETDRAAARSANVVARIADVRSSVDSRSAETAKSFSAVRDEIELVEATVESSRIDTREALKQLETGLSDRVEAVKDQVGEVEPRLRVLAEQSAEQARLIDGARTLADSDRENVDLLLGLRSQEFARRLTADEIGELVSEWSERLGTPITENLITYMERKLVHLESSLVGRIATTAADAVLRAFVARSLAPGSRNVLEIGVLFAINAAFLWEVAGVLDGELHQTLIDPFEGYYGDSAPDPISGLPVTERVAVENLVRTGIPEDRFTVITGYSGDASVRAEAAKREYGMILIDGDHSYEGVVADLAGYRATLAPDGLILFDDYGASNWPGVAQAVDEAVEGGDLELVGVFGRTAVARLASS